MLRRRKGAVRTALERGAGLGAGIGCTGAEQEHLSRAHQRRNHGADIELAAVRQIGLKAEPRQLAAVLGVSEALGYGLGGRTPAAVGLEQLPGGDGGIVERGRHGIGYREEAVDQAAGGERVLEREHGTSLVASTNEREVHAEGSGE